MKDRENKFTLQKKNKQKLLWNNNQHHSLTEYIKMYVFCWIFTYRP